MGSIKLSAVVMVLVAMLCGVGFAGTGDSNSAQPFTFSEPAAHQNPKALEAFNQGIDAFMHLDRPTAIEHLLTALENAGGDTTFTLYCRYYLSVAYSYDGTKGDAPAAKEHMLAAIAIDSTCPELWYHSVQFNAHLYREGGDVMQCMDMFLKYAKGVSYPDYHKYIGATMDIVLDKVGDESFASIQYAVGAIREFLGKNPNHFNANVFYWYAVNKLAAAQAAQQTGSTKS